MDHGSSGMDMDMGAGSCKISMLWNWNTVDSCFISPSWRNETRAQFAGSVIGVFFLVVGIEAIRRLGREYDRRLVAASRARQRKELVAGGFGPSCAAAQTGKKKECPKMKAQREQQQQQEKKNAGACCSKRNVGSGSSSSSEMGSQTDEDIQLADEQKNSSKDLEADLPVFNNPTSAAAVRRMRKPGPIRPSWGQQIMRGLFFGSQFSAAFLVMLIGMYYNGYMLFAIFLGGTVGYIAFGSDTLFCPQMGSDSGNCC